MTAFSSRQFIFADFPALYRFAGECVALNGPGRSTWNPGDIAWQLGMFPETFDLSGEVRLWESAGSVAALCIFEPPLNFTFEIHPRVGFETALADDIFGWVQEQRAKLLGTEEAIPIAYQMLGESTLSTEARDSDAARIAFLEEHGYQKVERHSVHMARSLDEPVDAPAVPPGYRFRYATDADIEARAELHRDAWSVWGPSQFSASRYRRLRAQPVYDETLDVVVEDESGLMQSYCIAWYDAANRVGNFEPVGTRPGAAGRGLGRAVVMEGLRRLRERGARTALIGTASVNEPAVRCYTACGFELMERAHMYSKPMG
ncbi:MAG: GNAT family N-acetyltransferase [Dehalococcoidia bacterium]